MQNFTAIILAAGKGTRFKSHTPKVLHRISGRPMLFYPLNILKTIKPRHIAIVVGHKADEVKKEFNEKGISFVHQEPQLGTGHAVMCALKRIRETKGDILILSGDVPLITRDTVKALFDAHKGAVNKRPVISFITTGLNDPTGYGRVLRDSAGNIKAIVEHKDCNPNELLIKEVNTGIYLIDSRFLRQNLGHLKNKNAQGEFYLPDLVRIAHEKGLGVQGLMVSDVDEVMGINTRAELAKATGLLNKRILNGLMQNGVTIIDPASTYIDSGVSIGHDTIVYPGSYISGNTSIGAGCSIGQGAGISDSTIGDNSTIKAFSVIEESSIGSNSSIGPFAHLRPGNVIRDNCRIGNFVELKKSTLGKGSKANHLSYLGDSVIGRDVNIGAGTITCNYDGLKKHTTTIKDKAFIGSDTQLVAPVTVGKGAYIGSGTTVTKDVPPHSLVITRAPERVIKGWVKKRLASKKH
jgi:bifunctional UDP-N-acetylglucosamine pyrophosphorylase/glucosamine-1-phosphate N-acetyltransferase